MSFFQHQHCLNRIAISQKYLDDRYQRYLFLFSFNSPQKLGKAAAARARSISFLADLKHPQLRGMPCHFFSISISIDWIRLRKFKSALMIGTREINSFFHLINYQKVVVARFTDLIAVDKCNLLELQLTSQQSTQKDMPYYLGSYYAIVITESLLIESRPIPFQRSRVVIFSPSFA